MKTNLTNSVNLSQETIPSQAAKAECVTTRAKARSAKWREVSGPFMGEEIVCSAKKFAAGKIGNGLTNHSEHQGNNDVFPTRIDVLYGTAQYYDELGVRLTG